MVDGVRMNAEAALWWSLFDANVEAARQRKILRSALADDLIPAERWEILASITTTQYIQLARNRNPSYRPPEAGGQNSFPLAASGSLPKEGDVDETGEYRYHKCPACGQMKPYKEWWPKAKCWECYKGGKA